MRISRWAVLLLLSVCLSAQNTKTSALLVISIDGLAAGYLNDADKYQLKIPTLRRLIAEGAHATGVRGVFPTVTYPSHTTLLTGVSPAKHGILENTTFDPQSRNQGGWYWYAEDIHVPTLWDVAAKAGYPVGSVSWPVTAGARSINYLIPEYWRATTDDDRKLLRVISTPGLIEEIEKQVGPYIIDLNDAVPGDWMRTRYAEAIIRRKHARFVTVHLAALDHLEHDTGPYTPVPFAALEETDKMVATLEKAMRDEASDATICIVSDHGFARTDHELSLRAAFTKAGLLTPATKEWKAAPWGGGGSSLIVLKDPKDAATRSQVEKLLTDLAANPESGIDHIMDRAEIAKFAAAPNAEFAVDMKPGYAIGTSPDVVMQTPKQHGQHGYSPVHPELRASFVIAGPGIRKGVNLGDIDMRSIAPTLAKLLGSSLPSAEVAALNLF